MKTPVFFTGREPGKTAKQINSGGGGGWTAGRGTLAFLWNLVKRPQVLWWQVMLAAINGGASQHLLISSCQFSSECGERSIQFRTKRSTREQDEAEKKALGKQIHAFQGQDPLETTGYVHSPRFTLKLKMWPLMAWALPRSGVMTQKCVHRGI